MSHAPFRKVAETMNGPFVQQQTDEGHEYQ